MVTKSACGEKVVKKCLRGEKVVKKNGITTGTGWRRLTKSTQPAKAHTQMEKVIDAQRVQKIKARTLADNLMW